MLCRCRHDSFSWHVSSAGQLSAGEVQRLAIARLLLERPCLAVLDEATSAVGSDTALALYGAIRAAGIATLTLAQHGSELRECHDLVVALLADGRGGWTTDTTPQPSDAADLMQL